MANPALLNDPNAFYSAYYGGSNAKLANQMAQLEVQKDQQIVQQEQLKTVQAMQDFTRMQQISAQLQKGLPGAQPGDDLSTTMMRLADVLVKGGDIDRGEKALAAAGMAAYHQSMAAARIISTNDRHTLAEDRNRSMARDTIAQEAHGVTDEPGFQQLIQHYEQLTGEPAPFSDLHYSPENLEYVEGLSIKEKAKIDQQIKQRGQDEQKRYHDLEVKLRNTSNEIAKMRARTGQAREERETVKDAAKAKVAGAKVVKYSEAAVKATMQVLKKRFPELKGSDLHNMAKDVAQDAEALQASNPGLMPSEAQERAITKHAEQYQEHSTMFGFGKEGKYVPKKAPAAKPATADDYFDHVFQGK